MHLSDPVLAEHIEWMRHRRLSEETVRLRTIVVNSIIGFCHIPPLTCVPECLEQWERSLHVADTSRATYIAQVHAFYAWATVTKKIDRNPSTGLVAPRLPRRQPRPISEPDLAMALMTAPDRIKPWLELAAYAGFRAGEVARLERADVHDELDNPVLLVRGKGHRERVVPMAARVWSALLVHGLPRHGWVFPRLDGEPGPITAYRVSQLAARHLHSIGVDATLHQLRHRFLTEIYRETKDLRLTQDLAGHSSPTTTAGYAAWSPEAAAAAVAALDRRSA